jgi:hypothetical protein
MVTKVAKRYTHVTATIQTSIAAPVYAPLCDSE